MRIFNFLGIALAASIGIAGTTINLAKAVQLGDGTISFIQPPRLVSATSTFKQVNVWSSTYYFTLDLPDNAGEPLQRVTISLKEGGEYPRFYLDESSAFEGTPQNPGQKLALGEVTRDKETRTLSVNFDPPVSPGKTITIRLRPVRNPSYSGVYLFGVTAFPAGEKVSGQFIGYGRLHFYDSGRDRFFD